MFFSCSPHPAPYPFFFSNLQSARDSHVCCACISLKKGVYSHLPSNRCNSILYHLLVCPNLLHNFKTAGWLKLGHVLAKKGAALEISGRQKSPKIQQEQRYENCPFCGFTEIIFILANDVTGRFFGSILDALYILRVSQPRSSQHPTEWCTQEKHTHRVLV